MCAANRHKRLGTVARFTYVPRGNLSLLFRRDRFDGPCKLGSAAKSPVTDPVKKKHHL